MTRASSSISQATKVRGPATRCEKIVATRHTQELGKCIHSRHWKKKNMRKLSSYVSLLTLKKNAHLTTEMRISAFAEKIATVTQVDNPPLHGKWAPRYFTASRQPATQIGVRTITTPTKRSSLPSVTQRQVTAMNKNMWEAETKLFAQIHKCRNRCT